MRLTLRLRIFLTLVPPFLLIAVLGTIGVVLLSRLGGGIGAILHDNYRSVLYMERLGEALERIDSSFPLALAGYREEAQQQYDENWKVYWEWFAKEQANLTEPGEDQLVEQLVAATRRYERQGKAFYQLAPGDPVLRRDYFDRGGLLDTFKEMKGLSAEILHLNQKSMEQASKDAKQVAADSVVWFGLGLAAAVVLAGFSAWHTLRTLLYPIRAMTQAALGISAGNLDQVVPYEQRDELGQLAQAFNTMARHLRDYRQSLSARLLRRSGPVRLPSTPFPIRSSCSIPKVVWRWPTRPPGGYWAYFPGKTARGVAVPGNRPNRSRSRRRGTVGPARLSARRFRPGGPGGP